MRLARRLPGRPRMRVPTVVRFCAVVCLALVLLGPGLGATAWLNGTLPGPLPLFPRTNWWNLDISSAPVDGGSTNFINYIGATRGLHPDFGGDVSQGSIDIYGFPYVIVDSGEVKQTVTFQYSRESDGVDHNTNQSYPFYPIPEAAKTQPHWIEGGAPAGEAEASRAAVTQADVHAAVLADLETFDRRARRFQRYFTLTHLYNAGLSDEELQTYRNALAKLVNSLSWGSKIVNPVAVDARRTVLRVDLRWYVWDATVWNRILQEYPYGLLDDSVSARAVSPCSMAFVRVYAGTEPASPR